MSVPFLDISVSAYRKLMAWVMQARLQYSEVSGFGEIEAEMLICKDGQITETKPFTPFKQAIKIDDFNKRTGDGLWIRFTLKDVWFLSGEANTATETNITPEVARAFFEKRTAEGLPTDTIKCWWH